jgi:hypothetical protein
MMGLPMAGLPTLADKAHARHVSLARLLQHYRQSELASHPDTFAEDIR